MKSPISTAFGILLCLFILFPGRSEAQVVADQEAYRATLIELIKVLQKQIILLKAEIADRAESDTSVVYEDGTLSNQVYILDTYIVYDIADVEKISNKNHRQYFERVFELFPGDYDAKLKRLVVFRDEGTGYDAFVETIRPLNKDWLYAVNEEILDFDADSNDELIIHELAHIISYEEVAGVARPVNYDCHSYFDKNGCPTPNSFISQFSNKFWSSTDLSRAKSYVTLNNSEDAMYDYYLEHKDEYVSDYAVSSPEEDFSETFMFYTLALPSNGEIAKEKIEYLASYPKLLQVKNKISESLSE